jgi:hypothetical protein
MSEADQNKTNKNSTPLSEGASAGREHKPESVVRIPRVDKKPTGTQESQSKVISLKKRSIHLPPNESPLSKPQVAAPPEPSQAVKIELLSSSLIHTSPMLPLIDRMEQQINKVTSNLMARVEQSLSKLEEESANLERNGLVKQEQGEKVFSDLCEGIASSLDESAEDARGKLLDMSATGQRTIQNILETGNDALDQRSKEAAGSLLKRSKVLRIELGQLTQMAQKKFSSLVKQRASDVHALIEMIKLDWKKLTSIELKGMEERGEKANDLLSKETESISSTFDQYCQSLERDIDEVSEQCSYEINLTRKQYVAAADETLRIWRQRLVLLTKSVIDSEIVPRLKELRDKLDNQVEELRQQFIAHYESDKAAQMEEVEAETGELKRQFRILASEAEASVYDTITEQQSRISQLFIDHRDKIRNYLRNTEDELESIHTKLKQSDATCRKLLISSGATLGLNLAADRERLISNLQELRKTTLQTMEERLREDTATLEEISRNEKAALANCSKEQVRLIKESCRNVITEIQAEVEQSFQEIQKSREKFLQ